MDCCYLLILESGQIGLLEEIKKRGGKEPIKFVNGEEDLPEVLSYLQRHGYVEPVETTINDVLNGDETDYTDCWKITEDGRRVLEYNENEIKRREKAEKQERMNAARSWISVGIAAGALFVSIVALALK